MATDGVVDMGPVQHAQRKGSCCQHARSKPGKRIDTFDELQVVGLFRRPEYVGVTIEYHNP